MKEKYAALSTRWEAEKRDISAVQSLREEIEKCSAELEKAQREYDLQKASELQYGKLPELKKKLEESEKKAAADGADGNGGTKIRERNEDLEKVLSEYVGQAVKLIPCGGGDRIAAEREQWNDGSNTLCVRPGTVVVYQRNNVTNDVLYKQGINCLEMPSAELSRGRGGPRCMSMPAWREAL